MDRERVPLLCGAAGRSVCIVVRRMSQTTEALTRAKLGALGDLIGGTT